jgi:hypothetical protein
MSRQIHAYPWGNRRSQWPRGLRHKLSSLTRTLASWVRVPLKAWTSVCVYSVFVLFCVYVAALWRADHSSKESYSLCKKDYGTEEEDRNQQNAVESKMNEWMNAMDRRLVVSQSRSGCPGVKKNFFALPGTETRPSSPNPDAIRTELSRHRDTDKWMALTWIRCFTINAKQADTCFTRNCFNFLYCCKFRKATATATLNSSLFMLSLRSFPIWAVASAFIDGL